MFEPLYQYASIGNRLKKSFIAALTSAGVSSIGTCPDPGITSSLLPGMSF